ncbi:MAG: hypothetical protein PUD59_03830 [bacterium]|nr:hypothetical protein [bacterium]
MNHINALLLKLTEKQKNMVLNIKPDFQITLYDYVTTVLIKHVDEIGYVTVNGKKILLDNYINNIIYKNSSTIEKFLYDNGSNIENLQEYFNSNVFGTLKAKENDVDYTLTCQNTIYSNSEIENICIKDIIGTLCEDKNSTLEQMLESLYSNQNPYSSRNNSFLKMNIDSNIENIRQLAPINIVMIDNKYYIKSDGHHRIYYLLLCYLLEISKCKSTEEIERTNKKYTFAYNVSKKSNSELLNMISYAMIKCRVEDLTVLFIDNSTGLIKIQLNDKIIDVYNENELINLMEEYLKESYNPELINMLNAIGFFERTNLNLRENNSSHKM